MRLEAPLALAFLLALPLLLYLESLRHRPAERRISSADLWRGLLLAGEGGLASSLRRLDAAAWARAAALGLAVGGIAGPSIPQGAAAPLRIVLDRSASMAADAGGGRSRLEVAVGRAIERLERFPAGTPARLERLPGDPGPLAGSLAEVRRALAECRASDAPLEDAALLRGGGATLVVTDHRPGPLAPSTAILAAGPAAENAGFVAFEAAERGEGSVEVWALLRNFSSRSTEREAFAFGAAEVPLGRIALGPGGSRALSAVVAASPVVGLRLAGGDALAADDVVRAAPGAARLRARIAPDVPEAVARALVAAGGLDLLAGEPVPGGDLPDLAVGRAPGPPGRFRILLDAGGGTTFEPVSVRFAQPLLSGVDLSGVRLGPARVAPGESRPLLVARDAGGAERPVAVEGPEGWTLAFDPAAGNWKEHASFPVFFAVAVDRARERAGRFGFVRAGERLPEGGIAERVGLLERGDGPPLAVNLLSAEESALPGDDVDPTLPSLPRQGSRSLAPLAFLVAAAGVGVSLLLDRRRG